jgi:30S ribosomal protein S31
MGKGDKKSKKGKITIGSFGKLRPARKANVLSRKAALKKA